MRQKTVLTVSDARQMMAAGRAEAERRQWAVTLAVVDDAGFLLALERLDGALPQSAEIAVQKARTAALMRMPTKALEDAVKERPGLVTLPGVVRVQGGLPIKRGVECLGAVGVSGVAAHEDEEIAAAALAALPFEP